MHQGKHTEWKEKIVQDIVLKSLNSDSQRKKNQKESWNLQDMARGGKLEDWVWHNLLITDLEMPENQGKDLEKMGVRVGN